MNNRAALVFILVTVALDSIGIGLIFPVMPDLLEQVTGGTLAQAAVWGGVLATSFAIMQFLFGPALGSLSDRFGRRPVLLGSLAVMAVNYVVMALAGSVWLLLVGRLMAGVASATQAAAAACIADISTSKTRARNFGLLGACLGAGFILGPAIGGLLATQGVRAPFAVAAALATANLTLGAIVLPETVTDARRRAFTFARANPLGALRAVARLPGLGRLLTVFWMLQVANYVYPAIWSFYGKAAFGWDTAMIGISLAIYGAAMAASQAFLTGPTMRWLGERRALAWGLGIDLVSLVFYGLVRSGAVALIYTPFAALGGLATPALQSLASAAAPEDAQGELQGVLASLNALAMIVSPVVMTATFSAFTAPGAAIFAPGAPFLLGALLMVAAIVLFVAPARAACAPAR